MIAFMSDKDLGLLLQAPERGSMNDPVPIPGKGGPGPAFGLFMPAAPRGFGALGKGGAGGDHEASDSRTAAPFQGGQSGLI